MALAVKLKRQQPHINSMVSRLGRKGKTDENQSNCRFVGIAKRRYSV
ncbi:hypothetical protein EMIT074MI3_50016 [Bacillus licheniformis]|nr:hypothetical protein CHCC15087_4592 [Bacillus licheniformis]TWO06439.1 hypothetical protein CHCC14431_0526 [Bacillus licheniformis]